MQHIDQTPGRTGFGVLCAVNDARQMRVQDRTRTHGTRLERHVERALPQPPAAKRPAGLGNGLDLRVRQGSPVRFPAIAAAADDPVIQCNHTPHWDLALRGSLLREKQSLAHHVFIQNRSHTSTAGLFTHHTRKRPIRQHPAPPRKKSPPVML